MGDRTLTILGFLGYALFLNQITKFKAERGKYTLGLETQHPQLELDMLKRTEVQLNLRLDSAYVVVTVTDNGTGFNPTAISKKSHGLMGMRYRVEAHAGKLRLQSSVGNGTQIEAWLPIKVEDAIVALEK